MVYIEWLVGLISKIFADLEPYIGWFVIGWFMIALSHAFSVKLKWR